MRILVAILCVIAALQLACMRIDSALKEVATHSLVSLATNETVTIDGWIADAPDIRPAFNRYVIQTKDVRGRFLVNDYGAWPRLQFGDFVRVTGTLNIPESSNDFDYAAYLRSQNIDAVMSRGSIRKLDSKPAPFFIRYSPLSFLIPFREWFEGHLRKVFPEPHASLLDGLLIGATSGLSKDITEEFRIAGLSHIVAVSGTNVTIVLTMVSSCLFFLPIKKRFFPMLLATICFVLLVGASAPVVRAGIMGILGLIAIQAERQTLPRLLILWTAFFMAMWNPFSLWHDPGFQLSFLAILGITELGPLLKRLLPFITEKLGVRDSLATTLAAQIATLPISILIFRQFSLIAPLSNLLIAPLIPVAMLLGFIATILGTIWLPLGLLFGYPAWLILELMLWIVKLSAAIPGAAITF